MTRTHRGLSLALTLGAISCAAQVSQVSEPTLVGHALLPAATFAAGPTSGAYLSAAPIQGVALPFRDRQPVQGVSAVVPDGQDTFLALIDNGFGSIENSADSRLRIYRLRAAFRGQGGDGAVKVQGSIELRDPDRQVPFAIVNHFTSERFLTGADFDPESLQRAPDGTLWIGDEFGPFLLHVAADGRVLEPPIPLPDPSGGELRSPQSPYNEEASALRVMNALRGHAAAQVGPPRRTPVFSPWAQLLDDGDPATIADSRGRGVPASAGVSPASSELWSVASLQSAGFPVVTWTVNDRSQMDALLKLGVNGIISDRPDLLAQAVRAFDKDQDGRPDYLDAQGMIDPACFDAQGHRGGRNLRPENTLPAFEVALDEGMTTLELDLGLTRDGTLVISHDPAVAAQKCRRSDGAPYTAEQEVLISSLAIADLQKNFICDKLFRGPEQKNDLALSPVSVAFARTAGLSNPYAKPTLAQLFGFVAAYEAYYTAGAGRAHPQAATRARTASRVRFNSETKINPRKEYAARTAGPEAFIAALEQLVRSATLPDLTSRVDVQSFDLRTLLLTHQRLPALRTVALLGDFPRFADPNLPGSDDGTNLQEEGAATTPWLSGLPWPYRVARDTRPFHVQRSGGLEGMALSPDGRYLLPMLEKPLSDQKGALLILQYDLRERRFTDVRYRYPLDAGTTAAADFQIVSEGRGLVIERDDSEGKLDAKKLLYEVTLPPGGGDVQKRLVVDLLRIADPGRLAGDGQPGDVGLGATYAMPYFTIESVALLGPDRVLIINDNNYPFGAGRHVGQKAPDDTELVLIQLPQPLH